METGKELAGYNRELWSIINARVKIQLKHKDNYYLTGLLKGVSRDESLILVDASDTLGNMFAKIVVHGSNWLTITMEETPFPMEGLYQRLKGMFPPGQVKYVPELNAISIMGKINVTEEGVAGTGPLAERVKTVYDQYLQDIES